MGLVFRKVIVVKFVLKVMFSIGKFSGFGDSLDEIFCILESVMSIADAFTSFFVRASIWGFMKLANLVRLSRRYESPHLSNGFLLMISCAAVDNLSIWFRLVVLQM